MNWITSTLRLFGAGGLAAQPQGWAWDDRRAAYAVWDAYRHNTIYHSLIDGGQRPYINEQLGSSAVADLAGLYNPVANVIGLYQHIFGGEFGVDIRLDPAYSSPAVIQAIGQIWQRSNINRQKQQLCAIAPTTGNAGIRIVMRDARDPAKRRVYLKIEHPRIIRDMQRDERGNVVAIELEYELADGVAEQQRVWTIRELLTPDMIRTYRIDDSNTLIPFDLTDYTDFGAYAEYANPLGIVPYVILDHEPADTWGLNAFYRATDPLNALNALMTHINVQIHDHVNVTWFVGAAGPAPQFIKLDGRSVAYVDTRAAGGGGTAPPFMMPMVAPLNLADSIAQSRLAIELIEDMLPELKATAGKFLAGQSGQTIAELRKPAEDKIALARINYEDALIRAQQIALSAGVLLGLWDVGSGIGTLGAAEKSYQSGQESHRFNNRPLLSSTDAPLAIQMMNGGA